MDRPARHRAAAHPRRRTRAAAIPLLRCLSTLSTVVRCGRKTKGDPPLRWSAGKQKTAGWRKAGKVCLPLIPLCPRRWSDEPVLHLPIRSIEHLQRQVIGLREPSLTLPLRDSAGLVPQNVTGLPPLCAAHPGVGRTFTDSNSIVPPSIGRADLNCQPPQGLGCIPDCCASSKAKQLRPGLTERSRAECRHRQRTPFGLHNPFSSSTPYHLNEKLGCTHARESRVGAEQLGCALFVRAPRFTASQSL